METYQALNTRHKNATVELALAIDDIRAALRAKKRELLELQSVQTAERAAWYAQNAERKAHEPKRPVGRPRKDDDTAALSRGIGIEPGTYVPPERDWTVWIEAEDGNPPADLVAWKASGGRRIEYTNGTNVDL